MAQPWPIPLPPAKGDPLDSTDIWNGVKRPPSIESDPFSILRGRDAENATELEAMRFMKSQEGFVKEFGRNYTHCELNLPDIDAIEMDDDFEECHVADLRPQLVPAQVPQSHPERQKSQRKLQQQIHPTPPDIPVVMRPHNTQYPEYPNGHHPYSGPPFADDSGFDQHSRQQRQRGLFKPNVLVIDPFLDFSSASSVCPGQTQAPNHPPSAQASTSFYASTSTSRTSAPHTGTTYSRSVSSALISRPYRCPRSNCSKSYKSANGLKYHMTHGSCNSASSKDSEALQTLLLEKGVVVNGADLLTGQITEGELRELEREAERRRRPFACAVGDCQRRYMNMNGLRYHYRHSGDHGAIGLQLLASGQHECFQQSKSAAANCHADSAITSPSTPSPSKSAGTRSSLHNPQGFEQSNSQEHVPASRAPTDRPGSDHARELSTDDPQCVDVIDTSSSPTLEDVPTSVTLLPFLVSTDGLASDPTRKLLVNDQQYITTSPSQEHIPASQHALPDKLLPDYVPESPADDKQRIDATSISALSPARTPPGNLKSDSIPELLADGQKDNTAISTSSSAAQGYTQVHASSHGFPDNPLSDNMHKLSTTDRQRIDATNTPSCSIQSSPLRIPTPPDKLHPTLSCWIKNMNKLSSLIDRLQELASLAPQQHRSKLSGQVATLRAMFKKQQEHCVEFLQLSEEYANRYLLDISAEIQQQSDFLDKLEERLEAATKLRGEAVDLQMYYESGTVANMENFRATALSRPLPEDQALFDEVDLVLTEIRRCYAELDKFWTEEISRALEALRMRHVDPTDFERWKNFHVILKQTVESWKNESPSADAQTLHGSNSCEEADIGAIASSLSSAVGLLTSALDRLPSSNSLKYLQSGMSSIQPMYVAFAANSDLCLSFLRRCGDYGEKVFACYPTSIASPAFSHVAPYDLRERTMRLLSETKGFSAENAVIFQGSRKLKVVYNKAVRLEQKTTSGLNTLLEELSSWVTATDGHGLPDDAFPDAISFEELRLLWEKARDSVHGALVILKDDPALQSCYRSATRASTRSRPLSVMKRWLVNFVCFS